MAQWQRQRDQDVEQDRDFKLVTEAVADLGGLFRPVRLPQRDVLQAGLPGFQRPGPRRGHPQQQEESEADQGEDRQ